MKKGWTKVKLGEISDIKGGKRLPKGHELTKNKTKHPYIRARDFCDGKVIFSDPVYINQETFEKIKKYTVVKNDICITIVGVNIGDVGIIPYWLNGANLTENAVKIINLRGVIPTFLRYSLINPLIKTQMQNLAAGAAQSKLGIYKVKEIEIELPEISLQEKIAKILSNYDDLIENNTKRIDFLEKIAKLIYEEWFVKFKFPGHEKVKFVDSELGKIPEGWEVKSVEDIASIQRGVSYKSSELAEEGSIPFVNLKCMLPGGNGGFRSSGLKRYNGKYKESQELKTGDIVMGITEMTQKREIIARPARIPEMNEEKITFSMDLVKVIPKQEVTEDYLYSFLKYSSFGIEVKEFANGVNVLHLNPKHITDYKFILPSKKIRDQFINLISKLFVLNDNLELKNQNLSKTRDLLLPRLITDKVDVSDLDIQIEVEA